MAYGIIGYSQSNAIVQASGSIWGDCSAQEILDESSGYFTFKTFVDAVTLPDLPSISVGTTVYSEDPNFDHALLVATGTTAQNEAVLFTNPTAPIAPGSGIKHWFEASISTQSIAENKGMFIGLVNKIGQTTGTLIQQTTSTAATNLLTAVSGTSLVGFWSHGDALTNFDAVYVNKVSGTGGLQPASGTGTAAQKVSTVLANVLTPAITQYPNSLNPLGYTGPVVSTTGTNSAPGPNGALTANVAATGTSTGATYNNTTGWVKLGLRYDGQQYLYFYVNGVQVAKLLISSLNFDVTATFGGVVAIQTGAASAAHMDVNFVRVASLLFP